MIEVVRSNGPTEFQREDTSWNTVVDLKRARGDNFFDTGYTLGSFMVANSPDMTGKAMNTTVWRLAAAQPPLNELETEQLLGGSRGALHDINQANLSNQGGEA